MIEVEAKTAILNPIEFREKAKKIGRFTEKEKKIDDYYTLQELNSYPKKSLRIRKINSFYMINFKRGISYVQGVHAKKENEFKVSDLKGFLDLIKDFGFVKWLTKEKESEIYRIKDNFHIEINKVKHLGWFLEVEYLVAKDSEIPRARKEILNAMRKLGIDKKDISREGYTKMLWDKGFAKKD